MKGKGKPTLHPVDRVLQNKAADGSALVNLWETRAETRWPEDQRRLKSFVRRALDLGEFLLVCDATAEALANDGADFDLRLFRARALRRVGSRPEALDIIHSLAATPKLATDRQTQLRSLSADIAWEAALEEEEPEQQAAGWKTALEAFQKLEDVRRGDPLPVIRQAALESLLKRLPQARREAKRALRLCQRITRPHISWVHIRGYEAVAWLILGDLERAAKRMQDAIKADPAAVRDHARLRHRVRMINNALGRPASEFDEFFPSLSLVVYSGHKIDEPTRKAPRFPKDDIGRIEALIQWKLGELKALIGIGSGACGADILFHEAMLARGGSVHLVLPWTLDRFLKNSVEPHPHAEGWAPRFEHVWGRAASRRIIGEFEPTSEDIGLSYARSIMAGRARLIARSLHLDLIPLALWDGVQDSPGGTGGFIRFWRRYGIRPAIIKLHDSYAIYRDDDSDQNTPVVSALPAGAHGAPLTAPPLEQQVKAMLFADIVGYSKLPEQSIPAFVHAFLGGVSRLASTSRFPPLSVNTWGDAIYLVFDTAEGAGEFALDLIDFVTHTDWESHELMWTEPATGRSRPLTLRVGLHAGPVFVHFDPVVRRLGFTGAHVSRAARIEPIADEGKVFASEEFAALAAVEQARGFACEYVGTRKLAKKYPGDFLLYRLRRITPLPLDDLARAIHASYCRRAGRLGETIETRPALRLWDDLTDDYKRFNREAAAALPGWLDRIGCILEPSPPGSLEDFTFTDEEVDLLAKLEHERYCRSLRAVGWRYGAKRDETKKLNPSLVPWSRLSAQDREWPITQIREIPHQATLARQRIRRLNDRRHPAPHPKKPHHA